MQNGKIFIAGILSLLLALNNCMAACISGESQIGLVLSGGGAKGAYEVGVWEALKESHVADDICAISGTSIGAINAALRSSPPGAAPPLRRKAPRPGRGCSSRRDPRPS